MPQREIVKISEHIHPQDFSKLYLVQIAVDAKPCVPFWSHEAQRRELGEEAWLQSLFDNAENLIHQYGPAPALT
jgi:hypothetical protein